VTKKQVEEVREELSAKISYIDTLVAAHEQRMKDLETLVRNNFLILCLSNGI
jgi:hypothetical protein